MRAWNVPRSLHSAVCISVGSPLMSTLRNWCPMPSAFEQMCHFFCQLQKWTLLKPLALSREGIFLWRDQFIRRKKKNLLRSVMYRIGTSGWRNPRPPNGCRYPGISALLFFFPNTGRKINSLSVYVHSSSPSQGGASTTKSFKGVSSMAGLLSVSTCFGFSFHF